MKIFMHDRITECSLLNFALLSTNNRIVKRSAQQDLIFKFSEDKVSLNTKHYLLFFIH